jgi:hypothetical protein
VAWSQERTTVPTFALALVGVLSVFNGQYYTKQSVANYAITHVIGYAEERLSVTTGMKVPTWGKEAKTPQSTMS